MNVCVYVCMYACMYVHTHTHIYIYIYVCVCYVRMCVGMYVCVYVCTYIRMYVCTVSMYVCFLLLKQHAPLHWVILHAMVQINALIVLGIDCGSSLPLSVTYL